MISWFQRWVLHNISLKLIALVSAVLLWSAVSREPVIEVGFNVPIEFHQVPEDLEITTEVVPQAQVRLRGPSRRVREEGWSLALHLFPTRIEQLLSVSDAGKLMPPKSTWFEPKLRSGLFVHPF